MAKNRKTVLVVDDEPDILNIVQTILEGEGYEVLRANDGLEVFTRLKERVPDLLIIDRIMPGMNGLEVVRRLKESPETSSIPIIMLTSMGKFDDVTEGYQRGADGYITKPFTMSQIINGVNIVLTSRPTLSPGELKTHAVSFLRACSKLSKRTQELTKSFATQDGLSPNAWSYKWLETRLRTDQSQFIKLKTAPEWNCCFRGWGVDFQNAETGEQVELAIGAGGRCDTFDEWRVQCYIENEAQRGDDFMDLHRIIEKYNDAPRALMDYLSRQGWIELARAEGNQGKKELDAQIGDRWAVSAAGAKVLTHP